MGEFFVRATMEQLLTLNSLNGSNDFAGLAQPKKLKSSL
jgi:hypothetical protein